MASRSAADSAAARNSPSAMPESPGEGRSAGAAAASRTALTTMACDTPAAASSSSSREHGAWAIAHPVRFAAPEAVGAKGHQVGVAADGRRQRRGDEVERVIAAGAREVDRFRSPFAPGTRRDELLPVRFPQQRRPPRRGGRRDRWPRPSARESRAGRGSRRALPNSGGPARGARRPRHVRRRPGSTARGHRQTGGEPYRRRPARQALATTRCRPPCGGPGERRSSRATPDSQPRAG